MLGPQDLSCSLHFNAYGTHMSHVSASDSRSFMDELCLQASRLGPCGLSPKAPGTVGSAAAVLVAPLFFMPLPLLWRVVVLLVLFVLGSLAATRAERLLGEKDPGQIVIDELFGQWLTLLPFAALDLRWMLTALALFRLFDIFKPYPVRNAEAWLPRGWGVMIDDGIAGLYAMLSLGLLRLVLP